MPILEIERVKQIFRFLKAFAERRVIPPQRLEQQPWQMLLRELPQHESITVSRFELGVSGTNGGDGSLISVRRPNLSKCPRPPAPVEPFLKAGWEDPFKAVEVRESVTIQRQGERITEMFAADPARVQLLGEWNALREAWIVLERPPREAMRVFERLYELQARMNREGDRLELLIADGRLRWKSPVGLIDHPLLLKRVELVFDTQSDPPVISIEDADRAAEVYSGLLGGIDGITSQQLQQLRTELEVGGYHPLDGLATTAFLRALAARTGARARFEPEFIRGEATETPVVMRDAVLMLRQRVAGFADACDLVLLDLEHQQAVPWALSRLVGVEPPDDASADPYVEYSPWGEPSDVLLSKVANAEQVQIARALDRHRAVLVQGPPGTGKSHTIANLVGHFVAQGKRVLVTSHTTKALRVLRNQVVESLRPLCVAVLEQDLESRSQLEDAVRRILARITVSSEPQLQREANELAAQREALIAEIGKITRDIQTARATEYEPILIAGEAIAPAEAARLVRANEPGNDWIPGPVSTSAPLPLTGEELGRLYQLMTLLTVKDEHEVDASAPDVAALPTSERFAALVAAMTASEPEANAQLWDQSGLKEPMEAVRQLATLAKDISSKLVAMTPWQKSLVTAGYTGDADATLWTSLATVIQQAHSAWQVARRTQITHPVEVVGSLAAADLLKRITEIGDHVRAGKKLGMAALVFRGEWREALASVRVNGQAPASVEDFDAISIRLTHDIQRASMTQRWARQAEPLQFPAIAELSGDPEPLLQQLGEQFPKWLGWWKSHWKSLSAALTAAGFKWQLLRECHLAEVGPRDAFTRDVELLTLKLPAMVSARLASLGKNAAAEQLRIVEATIASCQSEASKAILLAVRKRAPAEYEAAHTLLQAVSGKAALRREQMDLLRRLKTCAPRWAEAISARFGPHGQGMPPGDPISAWRWLQLHQEIERRARLDERELTRTLEQRRSELRRTTAELIDRKAWLAQQIRTGLTARSALQGWADTIKRIGKGTGQRVPELQALAREQLLKARDAVPVWIMPLQRVAESFDPRKGRFDVVIVDEASQSDALGLLAWYLSDRVLVVGDHEQVSPMAVGQQTGAMTALIAQHLADIPNAHLYDGTISVYDLARQCFGGTIALREHFRCMPDIIEFSNGLSYNFEIRPLRNPSAVPRPHLGELVVGAELESRRDGKTNKAEAYAVVALIKSMCEQPEFAGKSIGAISLLADEQSQLIFQLAAQHVGIAELERRKFIAGNPAEFQGDERDIILLTMVDAPTGRPLRMVQTEATKKRYNVAASRARDTLWLVHSLNPGRDLQAGDLRRRLIEHMRDPGAQGARVAEALARAESPFEADVQRHLIAAGFPIEPQVCVGRYRIDIVVNCPNAQIAVECDGDRFHGFDKALEDMERQAILERAGWQFIRIRGTRFYRDPERTMAWVYQELARLGAEPASLAGAPDATALGKELKDRIVAGAWQFMTAQGWLHTVAETESDLSSDADAVVVSDISEESERTESGT